MTNEIKSTSRRGASRRAVQTIDRVQQRLADLGAVQTALAAHLKEPGGLAKPLQPDGIRMQESRATLFEQAASGLGSAEAFEGLSWAAWWQDDRQAVLTNRERAFELYRREERDDDAEGQQHASAPEIAHQVERRERFLPGAADHQIVACQRVQLVIALAPQQGVRPQSQLLLR